MSIAPVFETDYYGKGFEKEQYNRAMKGPRVMSFGASRTDQERLDEAQERNKI